MNVPRNRRKSEEEYEESNTENEIPIAHTSNPHFPQKQLSSATVDSLQNMINMCLVQLVNLNAKITNIEHEVHNVRKENAQILNILKTSTVPGSTVLSKFQENKFK